jgi:hypothetical protein
MTQVLEWVTAFFALATVIGVFANEGTFTHRVAIGVDMLFAVVFLQRFDITLSSWAGIESQQGNRIASLLRNLLERIQPNHCAQAVEADKHRAMLTLAYLSSFDHAK